MLSCYVGCIAHKLTYTHIIQNIHSWKFGSGGHLLTHALSHQKCQHPRGGGGGDAACISGPVKAAANGTPPHQRGLIKSSIYLRQALDKQNPPQFPFCAGVQPSEVHWRTYWHSIKGGPLSKAGRCKSCAPLPSNFPLTQLLDCNNVTECSNQFWFTSGQHVAFSSAHCY